ncbi:MAG TPA: ferrochelatase [Burkholderiales bacterium]|nr:ferrochelatase [Burkholderiales bacterium]
MFAREPLYRHDSNPSAGILLVNLGTPEAPTAHALRPYLRQFLSDPRVVEIPRAIWWPVLNGIVLTTRPRQSAAKYAKIWTAEGSPLKVHTQRQALLLRGYLGERTKAPPVVDWAMRYGRPSVAEGLAHLREQGCDRVVVIPLYPQYSASATASAYDAVFGTLSRMRNVPALRLVKQFHDHPGYINALAQSVTEHWMANGRAERLVMSFHGIPRFALDRGDPYHCQCQKTARLLAESLGLDADRYCVTFQSRFGRAQWLKPYTIDTLRELAGRKVESVDILCPGFVSDCLETLEEIGIENRAAFLTAGGREFRYIACLNERDGWIRALTDIALEHLHGWLGAEADVAATEAEARRRRAQALGAPR